MSGRWASNHPTSWAVGRPSIHPAWRSISSATSVNGRFSLTTTKSSSPARSRTAFNSATRATSARYDTPASRLSTRRSIVPMLALRRHTAVWTAGMMSRRSLSWRSTPRSELHGCEQADDRAQPQRKPNQIQPNTPSHTVDDEVVFGIHKPLPTPLARSGVSQPERHRFGARWKIRAWWVRCSRSGRGD